jgi:hypothetical protein
MAAPPYTSRRYHHVQHQQWAVDQAQQHHEEALYALGEYSLFLLLWNIEDFEAGLVERCHVCYLPFGERAETFGQPAYNKCINCLGTTFEGGYKAKIIRPCFWDKGPEENDKLDKLGVVQQQSAEIQSTADFRLRNGDYVIRGDDSRWSVGEVTSIEIRSGFAVSEYQRSLFSFTYDQVVLEDGNTIIYKFDPGFDVTTVLDPLSHYPVDFTQYEDVRGPLGGTSDDSTATTDEPTWGSMTQSQWDGVSTTTWGDLLP